MCNIDKLLGKMKERGYTQETLAEAAGVSRATITRRIKETENLTIKEIEKISNALKLSGREAVEIFLYPQSLINETKQQHKGA